MAFRSNPALFLERQMKGGQNPTDLHTPQTLARHSSQYPGGKRETQPARKTTTTIASQLSIQTRRRPL